MKIFLLLFMAGLWTSTIAIAQSSSILSSGSAASNFLVSQIEDTDAQLQAFYQAHGGRSEFPDHYVRAIEAFLGAQDELAAGQRQAAKQRVDAVFAEMPLADPIWTQGATLFDLNVGNPIAYYGLRMLDQILQLDAANSGQTITMTVIVPQCAEVSRPTLPDLAFETLQRDIDDRILANNAEVLSQSTDLFRHWLSAITQGANVVLNVQIIEQCTTVQFQVAPTAIFSFPDIGGLIEGMSFDVRNETDLWLLVVPSGVPGDGSDFDRTFVTGGITMLNDAPVIYADDGWFVRKPAHLGKGNYSEVERRVYLPQWLQHEFMHNVFLQFPEFELEAIIHQWFRRDLWPDDFIGRYEPDYYAEALKKRLLDAQPTIVERLLDRLRFADFRTFPIAKTTGKFERQPIENGFHEVSVTINDDDIIMWNNKEELSWQLITAEAELRTAADSHYGEQSVSARLDSKSNVVALFFLGEEYVRVDTPPTVDDEQAQCFVVKATNGSVVNFCL